MGVPRVALLEGFDIRDKIEVLNYPAVEIHQLLGIRGHVSRVTRQGEIVLVILPVVVDSPVEVLKGVGHVKTMVVLHKVVVLGLATRVMFGESGRSPERAVRRLSAGSGGAPMFEEEEVRRLQPAGPHIFFEGVHFARPDESLPQFLRRLKERELRDFQWMWPANLIEELDRPLNRGSRSKVQHEVSQGTLEISIVRHESWRKKLFDTEVALPLHIQMVLLERLAQQRLRNARTPAQAEAARAVRYGTFRKQQKEKAERRPQLATPPGAPRICGTTRSGQVDGAVEGSLESRSPRGLEGQTELFTGTDELFGSTKGFRSCLRAEIDHNDSCCFRPCYRRQIQDQSHLLSASIKAFQKRIFSLKDLENMGVRSKVSKQRQECPGRTNKAPEISYSPIPLPPRRALIDECRVRWVTTITDSSRVGRPLSSQDPVEDFASDEEAPHAAPRTPPHAGRLACGKSPDEPGTGGQAEATKVQQGDFDLEALDAANQELADLEAKPSEPSEASEDEGQAEDGGALPEEPWERWSRRERELWERVRPRHLRREAHQVQGLRLPADGWMAGGLWISMV
ncbi:unnamed protein product [Durusdinium trenchii]|uniref:Uncharacterized protein n=1 Tax=Durusdinium trenchii TaxID=1381693 RepID=A0ABP0MEN2_9DINO